MYNLSSVQIISIEEQKLYSLICIIGFVQDTKKVWSLALKEGQCSRNHEKPTNKTFWRLFLIPEYVFVQGFEQLELQ